MKVIKCNFCNKTFIEVDKYINHLETEHSERIPPDMVPSQYYYYLKTGKMNGSCVVCHKKTEWNPKTNKYKRFCNDPKCKEKYIQTFRNRMIGKYGKVNLLNDPEQQKKMLANRKISGVYEWSDHIHKIPYTGSYELAFLEFLDKIYNFDPNDIIAPSPHTYTYKYENQNHFYIPDFFIPSLNLEIEIKDGGDNANMHPKIQAVDKVKEKLKDEVLMSNTSDFNYLKIVNKQHSRFFDFLVLSKTNLSDGIKKPIFMV